MRLVAAEEMKALDRMAIQDVGIPGSVLMENAARGATRIFLDHFAPHQGAQIFILCGRGNNGGDGYVMARYLHEAGMSVKVMVLAPLGQIAGDALLNLNIIQKIGLQIYEAPDWETWSVFRHEIASSEYLIDGILGTGLNAPVKGYYRQAIEDMNGLDKSVMAIDIPSGLNADSGQIMGVAVRAKLTVTFGFPKVGQVIFPGAGLVGRLVRIDIGIPSTTTEKLPARYHMTEPENFSGLFQTEGEDIHKGNRGHLLILAGSPGKTGAAALTALGALRAGAGLVTIGIAKSLNPILEEKTTEAMTYPLPETRSGTLALDSERLIRELMVGKTALAIGPGLSTQVETVALVRRIVADCPLPMVIDADGLNAISGEKGVLVPCGERTVLTPHPGEMGRLAAQDTAAVQSDRLGTVARFVLERRCWLVLKGARTLIAGPNNPIYVNPTGNKALASGGSGDVLTGFISGLLARGWPIAKAVLAGVYVHGLAADLLEEKMGTAGILAHELAAVFPSLAHSLSMENWPLNTGPPHVDFYHPL